MALSLAQLFASAQDADGGSHRVVDAAITVADRALLARVRAGDTEAFAALFRTHYSAAMDYASRILHDHAAAEDVVHTVFARILERHAALDVTTSLRGYVIRAVRREALHTLRHGRVVARHAERVMVADERNAPAADLEMDKAELFGIIERAIATLPARCREAYELRWRYELSYAEIAEAMGIAVKTVEMQLTRALKVVRAAVTAYLAAKDR